MKRWIVLIALLAASGGVLYYSQHHKKETKVGPEAMLNALAESQREISRLPARAARLSDAEEKEAGDAMAERYLEHHGQLSAADLEIEDYVTDVGRVVAAHARRKLAYRFHYIPDANVVHAFALPGGHIFLGKGMFQLMDSEDELANVLGHEVEHVDNYPCN